MQSARLLHGSGSIQNGKVGMHAGIIADGSGVPTGTPLADPPLIEMISEDALLRNTKLISEAWDCDGLFQVGAGSVKLMQQRQGSAFPSCVHLGFRSFSKMPTCSVQPHLPAKERLHEHGFFFALLWTAHTSLACWREVKHAYLLGGSLPALRRALGGVERQLPG